MVSWQTNMTNFCRLIDVLKYRLINNIQWPRNRLGYKNWSDLLVNISLLKFYAKVANFFFFKCTKSQSKREPKVRILHSISVADRACNGIANRYKRLITVLYPLYMNSNNGLLTTNLIKFCGLIILRQV